MKNTVLPPVTGSCPRRHNPTLSCFFFEMEILMTLIRNAFGRLFFDFRQNKVLLGCTLFYLVAAQSLFHSVCPIAIFFGVPCPACGLTRAGVLLLSGQWKTAWQMHPAVFLLLPYLLYLGFFRYVIGNKPPHITGITYLLGAIVIALYLLRFSSGALPPIWPDGIFPTKKFFSVFS